jgi:hypothetical protein
MPYNCTIDEGNRLLDLSVLDGDKVALMTTSGDPFTTGTEATGGSYARQASAWLSASGSYKTSSGAITFSGMPTCSLQGWELWKSDGSERKWYGLFAPKLGLLVGDTVAITAHGFAANQKIVFQAGYCPADLSPNVTYYVVSPTTDAFSISDTSGGSALTLGTGPGYGVIVGTVYDFTSGDTFVIDDGALGVTLF